MVGQSLVGVGQDVQADAVIADVGDIQQKVLREFLLDGEVPALYVTRARVWRRVAQRNVGVVDAGRIQNTRRIA